MIGGTDGWVGPVDGLGRATKVHGESICEKSLGL